jgi:flagellar biosynthesis/type III secretory pathway M-ring protein FliF/YscJ
LKFKKKEANDALNLLSLPKNEREREKGSQVYVFTNDFVKIFVFFGPLLFIVLYIYKFFFWSSQLEKRDTRKMSGRRRQKKDI